MPTITDSTLDDCITVPYNMQRTFHVWEGEKQMSRYYSGGRARHYNKRWGRYTWKTLAGGQTHILFPSPPRWAGEIRRAPPVVGRCCRPSDFAGDLLPCGPRLEGDW